MKTEAFSPGLEGVIAGATRISDVDPIQQSLMYRGYDIRDLAEHCTYEEVVYLLLHDDLPNASQLEAFREQLVSQRDVPKFVLDALRTAPQGVSLMDTLRAGVGLLALHDPDAGNNDVEANRRKATRLVAQIPTLVAAASRFREGQSLIAPDPALGHAENFLYMIQGKRPEALISKIFDLSLIVYAEHGFNASTFAGRVTVSTLSDLHSGVISAIGTLKGPLHGGANEEAMLMLQEIGSPDNAQPWLREAFATKRKVMGFGHREYKHGDPRAPLLKGWGEKLSDHLNNRRWIDIANRVEEMMVNEKNIHPNVDFPTAYIYYLMGLPIDVYTPIFALARVAGWSSHIIEQLGANKLIRPKALYEGPRHRPVPSLEQRG